MVYMDGFVAAVPTANKGEYKQYTDVLLRHLRVPFNRFRLCHGCTNG